MYNWNQQERFCSDYRAKHGGTKVEAMKAYRNLLKTNNPYTRPLKNEEIPGFEEWKNRGY